MPKKKKGEVLVAVKKTSGRNRSPRRPYSMSYYYGDDEVEFMKAMDNYKRDNRRPFPAWSEVLEVLRSLGYRKIAEPTS